MLVSVFKALADVSRLRIVGVLLHGTFTVQELTTILGVGQSRISWHLKILTDAGLLSVNRQGTWHYYQLSESHEIFNAVRELVERELPGIPEYVADCQIVARIFDERRTRSRSFFDTVATQWDVLARTLLPMPEYEPALLSLLPCCDRLAEVGVGTGALLVSLAEKASSVIGVDHSPAMLDEAKRKAGQFRPGGIDFRLGDMHHLPFPDADLDSVVLNMVLHHAAEPQVVLREMRRVLRPGGLLLLAELQRHDNESAREQLADQWLGFDGSELNGWCMGAGFRSCECIDVPTSALGQTPVQILRAYA